MPHRAAGHPGRDPGLQSERTALAWQRSGVSAAAVAGVAVLAAAHDGSPVLVGLVTALAAVVAVCAGVTAHRPAHPAGAVPPSPWVRLLAAATSAGALGVAGLLLAVSSLHG